MKILLKVFLLTIITSSAYAGVPKYLFKYFLKKNISHICKNSDGNYLAVYADKSKVILARKFRKNGKRLRALHYYHISNYELLPNNHGFYGVSRRSNKDDPSLLINFDSPKSSFALNVYKQSMECQDVYDYLNSDQ